MADLPKKFAAARQKNFIKNNIICAKRSYPSELKQRFVDTRHGDAHDLKSSGLYPIYVHKKNYGNLPKFIAAAAKVDTSAKKEDTNKRYLDGDKLSTCRYIDEEERKLLLRGMKEKWEEAMIQFQRLPFLTDTPPKVQRKVKMERELQQLEKDIAFIEQHPYIYVSEDNTAGS